MPHCRRSRQKTKRPGDRLNNGEPYQVDIEHAAQVTWLGGLDVPFPAEEHAKYISEMRKKAAG